jgi:general secretion pathway protein K
MTALRLKPSAPARCGGAALVIVMVLVLAMAVMAGTFAYSMKVETRLAVNTRSGADLEWLGRSGVEMAKWVLQQQRGIPGEGMYDGLNQFWAGGVGPMESVDNPYTALDMNHVRIGDGTLSIAIVDLDRKINLNGAPEPVLELAFQLLGAGAGDAGLIASAVLDWRDRDDLEHAKGGAEKSYYAGLNPPYVPKNGPFDDVSELLKIRGVTPALYWGARVGGRVPASVRDRQSRQPVSLIPEDYSGAGLVDVFTAISGGRVNVNTAPLAVLRILLGGDQVLPQQIIQRRAGPDGIEGTADDQPFRNPAEIPGGGIAGPGLFSVQSTTFEVHVEATLGSARKRFVGVIRRGAGREGQLMLFHPE